MSRYIIECEDPADIILGMRCIQTLLKSGDTDSIIAFDNGSLWYVKRTKTGYSARTKLDRGT